MSKDKQQQRELNLKHVARALDMLTVTARGLQETDCPPPAMVCAAQDLLLLTVITLFAFARQGGEETYTDALAFADDMLRNLREEIAKNAELLQDGIGAALQEQMLDEFGKIPVKKGLH